MTRVLLTGAAGFQASYIIRRLRAKYDLTLFDRAAPREEFSDLPFISGDITRLEDVERAMENCDAVVHLVALVRGRENLPLEAYCDVMVKGTWNVAHACATQKVQRLVNISSIVASGWPSSQSAPYRVTRRRSSAKPICFTPSLKFGRSYRQRIPPGTRAGRDSLAAWRHCARRSQRRTAADGCAVLVHSR
jgi:nucleoside-diphosphate-sugar epimerase